MFKKALVVGIIFLFIGVGFQPVFARETIIETDDSEEDCGCQSVSNINLGLEEFCDSYYEFIFKLIELKEKFPEDGIIWNMFAHLIYRVSMIYYLICK